MVIHFIWGAMLTIIPFLLVGQKTEKIFFSDSDPYKIYQNDNDSSQLHYYQLTPAGPIKAGLILLSGAFETTEKVMMQTSLPRLAQQEGFLVIVPSINWGTFSGIPEHAYLDTIISQVLRLNLAKNIPWSIGGFSKGGMLAIQYTERSIDPENKKSPMVPACVFAVDPPLDLSNLWDRAQKNIERGKEKGSNFEAHFVQKTLLHEFGGSPKEVPDMYLKYSAFTYLDKTGGNAKYLVNVPLLIYTEPDIDWQMEHRQRDYYDLNALDISAMINFLQQSGNKNAEMIITHEKGFRQNGERHPHSWSIMNANSCLEWILQNISRP